MQDYETRTKSGSIEKRVYVDSGTFVIYAYQKDGDTPNKFRYVFKGKEKRSFFLIDTGKARNITIKAEYEDDISVLKDGKSVKVSELL